MLSDTRHMTALVTQLDADVNETTKAGLVVEIGLADTQTLEAELDKSVENYIDVIIGYLDQYIDVAIQQVCGKYWHTWYLVWSRRPRP